MTRVILINTCEQCPHLFDYHNGEVRCLNSLQVFDFTTAYKSIHEGCPLPETELTEQTPEEEEEV